VETAPYLVRSYGDKQMFTMVDKDEGNSCSYEVFVIQSLQWPGFFTVINPAKQRWSHLYIGLATKANQPFIPKKLADFLGEPNDLKEHPEVNSR
jgi:hypothetical protein